MKESKLRLTVAALVTLMVMVSSISSSFAAPAVGGKCTRAGQKISNGNQNLVCSLVWTMTVPKTAATKAPVKTSKLQDKSFRLESISFNTDLGSAGANARITNISNRSKSASLGISIFGKDGVTVLLNLMGVVNDVAPGQTVTATFMSVSGNLPSGQFKYSFQVSAEF